MSSIREFEHVLHEPGKQTGAPAARTASGDDEKLLVRSAEGEVAPRLRHHEHSPQQQQQSHQQQLKAGEGKSSPSSTSSEEERGSSRLIDEDKVKLVKEKGSEAKKALQNWLNTGRSWGWTKWLLGLLAAIASLFFVGLMTMTFARSFLPYPSHASCQVNITFFNDQFLKTTPVCEAVKSAFVHQMKTWEGPENCKDGGMKCLYKVTHVGDDELTGTHKTSDWFGFTDELTFKFMDTERGDCFVKAYSRSTVPFAYFDFSVNYCNIHNLVEGYGFERFEEVTSDEVCTQFSTHDCVKY